jgi:flagellar L-ring protein precursor FlgH
MKSSSFSNHGRFAMSRITTKSLPVLLLVLLGGCATAPSTNIKQPLTARPQARMPVADNNGAIYQDRQALALFEDRRARRVGDTLTVKLVEKTEAKRKSETKEDRKAELDLNIPIATLNGRALGKGSTFAPSGSNTQEFKDDETNSNSVTGSITVTVLDVLDNGNLMVAGEKQVAVNNDTEYLRLAGVVNPRDITREGSVNSTQIADARIESKNSQSLDKSQMVSMMARFFLTVFPF